MVSRSEDALQEAKKALWLLCHLGGLGRRSRRGFGSLQIVEGELALKANTSMKLAEALKQWLDINLRATSPKQSRVPRFPILHPKWAQIRVCKREFEDWQEAIRFVMEKAHKYKDAALGSGAPRQASPVHVHVAKLLNGKYTFVLTTMLSQLNPNPKAKADRQKLVDFLEEFSCEVIFGFKEVPIEWPGGNER